MSESLISDELQTSKIDSTVSKSVKKIKVAKKKTVKIKNEGIATDFVKASVEGKRIARNRKKSLYKSGDSIEDMERATADLLTDSSRKVISKMEDEENNRLNELLSKTYSPRRKNKKTDEKKIIKNAINIV